MGFYIYMLCHVFICFFFFNVFEREKVNNIIRKVGDTLRNETNGVSSAMKYF